MRILIIFLTGFIAICLFSSCAVQKRRYMQGYYIANHSKKGKAEPLNATLTKDAGYTPVTKKRDVMLTTSAKEDVIPNFPSLSREKILTDKKSKKFFDPAPRITTPAFAKKQTSSAIKPAAGDSGVKVLSTLGLLFSNLSVLMIIGGLLMFVLGFEAGIGLLLVGFLLAFVALAICVIALIVKAFNPSSRGAWMAILGLLISAAVLYIGYLSVQQI